MCKPERISDEVMYDLLHNHLNQKLKRKFEVFEHQLLDDFDDIVDDFFLYLRDGKDKTNSVPNQSLYRIKRPEALGAWMVKTFRNYLSMRAAKTVHNNEFDDSPSALTDEQKLAFASNLIAYAHQTLSTRSRFIFLRSLLTMLGKQQTLPNEDMAQALGMTGVSYRVAVHRTKSNLAKFREQLLRGECLPLDKQHQAMAQQINDDFTNLYPTLLHYYNKDLEALNCADAVNELRQQHFEATGCMMHEADAEYSVPVTVEYLWNRLEKCLFQSPAKINTSPTGSMPPFSIKSLFSANSRCRSDAY